MRCSGDTTRSLRRQWCEGSSRSGPSTRSVSGASSCNRPTTSSEPRRCGGRNCAEPEVRGQIRLRLAQNLDDRPAVLSRQARISGAPLTAREDLPHPRVNRIPCRAGQDVELRAVNQVAAWVAQKPSSKIKITE